MPLPDSFAGVNFQVLHEGRDVAVDALVSERQIPGSNIVYLDLGGRGAQHWTLTMYFESAADALLFASKSGQSGTLSFIEGTWTAVMRNPRRASIAPLGDVSTWTAEFIRVSS